jgi:hypothetical protein
VLALLLAGGCSLFDDPAPEETRVVIEGEVGASVELITSSKFLAGVDQAGVTHVEILSADTLMVTLPFDRTFNIRGDYRFFSQASRVDADVSTFRMQVFIDTDREFDEEGGLFTGAPFRFVYQFNQFLTSTIDVTF